MKNKQMSRQEKRFKKNLLKRMNKVYRKYTSLSLDAEAQRNIFTYHVYIYETLFNENILEAEGFKDIRNMKIVEELYKENNNTEG